MPNLPLLVATIWQSHEDTYLYANHSQQQQQPEQQQQQSAAASNFNLPDDQNKNVQLSKGASPPVAVTMASNEMPRSEGMSAPQGLWTTPTSQGMRPRPATIHEGFSYSVAEGYDNLPSWDSSTLPVQQQTPSDTIASSRPISVHQEFYPPTTMESSECLGAPHRTAMR